MRAILRRILPPRATARAGALLNALAGTRKLGWREWRRLRGAFADRWVGPPRAISFSIPPLLHPITLRAGTSDAGEVAHTVLRESYGVHLPSSEARIIFDAGANIGDSTVWYLSRFPHARVFAIEPDAGNFNMLHRNCAPYGDRAVLVNAALWPVDGVVVLTDRNSYSGISARPPHADETAECEAISMTTLLTRFGIRNVDIFKCDIEGAETELFRTGGAWIERVGAFYIDTHGPEAFEAVHSALRGFAHSQHREVHVFINRKLAPARASD